MAHGKTRTWKKCSSCGGAGGKWDKNYDGVWKSCSSCGGSGGKMKVEDADAGCALLFFGLMGAAWGTAGGYVIWLYAA